MVHLIDKSALEAEIERRMQCYSENGCEPNSGKWVELISIKHFLNTIEVKEVDVEKEYKDFIKKSDNGRSMLETAKYFFELGLKAKQG